MVPDVGDNSSSRISQPSPGTNTPDNNRQSILNSIPDGDDDSSSEQIKYLYFPITFSQFQTFVINDTYLFHLPIVGYPISKKDIIKGIGYSDQTLNRLQELTNLQNNFVLETDKFEGERMDSADIYNFMLLWVWVFIGILYIARLLTILILWSVKTLKNK